MRFFIAILVLLPTSVIADLTNAASAWTNGPFLCIGGDSIPAGYSAYHTVNDGGPSGNVQYSLGHRIYANSAVRATNYAKPGVTWQHVNSTQKTQALAQLPKYFFVHAGINEIANNWNWLDVLTNINSVYASCVISNVILLVDEIFPDSNFDDTKAGTIRQWNTNLAAWVSTNSNARLSVHWSDMGQLRVSTGMKDDLAASYNSGDGVHLSSTGINFWSTLIIGDLEILESNPIVSTGSSSVTGSVMINGSVMVQ